MVYSPLVINIILIVVGLALGSFATAIAHRVPMRKSVGVKEPLARSACPRCNHTLGIKDLVPVLSWLSTGGKCRYCKHQLSLSYPLTELGVLFACLLTYWVKGLSPDFYFIIAAIPFFAALWVIDIRYMLLPNTLLLILGGLGLVRLLYKAIFLHASPDFTMILDYLTNVLFFAGTSWLIGFIMEKVLKQEALGMGDVKFFAMAGLWLGLSQLGWFCGLAGFFGVLFFAIFRNRGSGAGSGQFPFGPALITALFVLLLTEGSLFL